MQALRARQDENSGLPAPGKQNAENEMGPGGRPRGLKGGLAPGGPRKGVGNTAGQPGIAGRRALGDITNATPVGKTGSVLRKPLGGLQQATPRSVQDALLQPLRTRPAEELWAEEGIEQPAGKTWRQLEREREAATAAHIRASVTAILAPPLAGSWTPASPDAPAMRRSRLAPPSRPPTREPSPQPSRGPLGNSDLSDLLAGDTSSRPALEVSDL